ncbi:MAG: alanine dehydrogenase, partial [Bacteroidota bacterium]
MKIGIIREGKVPHDHRVPFSPEQCKQILELFPGTSVTIQPSSWRCFRDEEYLAQGVNMSEDISDCDVLMGIKEVPIEQLIEGKRYCFFSHTIKKQAHNQKLMHALMGKRIAMTDYECLVDPEGNRIIGFGRYAGIVGAYNG